MLYAPKYESLLVQLVPPLPRCFQRTLRYSSNAGPRTRKSPGSSSQELRILFRELFSFHWPSVRRRPTHQHRFFSSSRQQHQESTNSEGPTLRLTFHPQRFSRSRWVTPPSAVWIYFAPQPRAGFALQGFSLPLSRLRLIAGSFPHVVRPVRLPEASSRCQLADRRLQGVYQVTIRGQK